MNENTNVVNEQVINEAVGEAVKNGGLGGKEVVVLVGAGFICGVAGYFVGKIGEKFVKRRIEKKRQNSGDQVDEIEVDAKEVDE